MSSTETPMMRQFHAAKKDHPEEVLFFRMGDFYEMFFDDARLVSELLGITLTSRSKDRSGHKIPMAGIPVRSVDSYIQRLVEAGHRVAICEQVEDAAEAKGIVDRKVVKVVTPGTFVPEESLENHSPIHLAAYRPALQGLGGLAWIDLSTGKFHCQNLEEGQGTESLLAIQPKEILVPEGFDISDDPLLNWLKAYLPACTTTRWPEWHFEHESARQRLLAHFSVSTLDGFGVEHLRGGLGTAGALLEYLNQTQRQSLAHVTTLRSTGEQKRLGLDASTHRALDLLEVARTGERQGSLLGLLDRTRTAMGARLLREWLQSPLAESDLIRLRQTAVACLVRDREVTVRLRSVLAEIRDVERLASRLPMGRIHGRDLRALALSLKAIPELKDTLRDLEPLRFKELEKDLDADLAQAVVERIEETIIETPPLTLSEGGVIKDGFDPGLDELRSISNDGVSWMARFEAEESKKTGIPTLKVGYNRVFGYFIEVTHSHSDRIPESYIRKQTLKNAERYITPELKEMEEKVLGSRERADQLEQELFQQLRSELTRHIGLFQSVSALVAEVDVYHSLALIASEEQWCQPEILDEPIMEVEEGFHPVVGAGPARASFTPNDIQIGRQVSLAMITGPNMAGKSTYIRQAALISILSQMGSFVPAAKARIGIADRIFTRVGAADDLIHGQSTFMVEMVETARILHNATERSLVILDEVGRGTSTHDGVSIAWAIAEDLAKRVKCRTFFATHYHELVALEDLLPGQVVNLRVEVKEWKDEIVFLHKIQKGSADKSYGIHVARLAGIPFAVLEKARLILADLESKSGKVLSASVSESESEKASVVLTQQGLFDKAESEVLTKLLEMDVDETTPKEALSFLYDLKQLAKIPFMSR